MGSKICMNEACRSTTSSEWKNGWGLKSGGFATLCLSCGTAFEKLIYCETFHPAEDGWRECKICRKRVHCGCVASKLLLECLDYGGVGCISCVRRMDTPSLGSVQILGDNNGTLTGDVMPMIETGMKRQNFGDLLQIGNGMDVNGSRKPHKSQKHGINASLGQNKCEGSMLPFVDVNISSPSLSSSMFGKPDNHRPEQMVKDVHASPSQPSLNFSLRNPLSNPLSASSSVLPFSDGLVEGSEQNKVSPSQQGQRGRNILPKPPKPGSTAGSDAAKGTTPPTRIARPPAEGRGRNQLLPRYWPRISDQELQQISGDLKSTVVPLFEKMLSASDAGRIGRLVLPKACAEAYFPSINQSEGLPIRIQDVKGKEWTFQFRFWPNNNSRMYVLEGVTPCIQNMQLQAGDTVTFSRIDPGGQLVMGFRKSTTNIDTQDAQLSVIPNGGSSGENSHSGASDNMINGSHPAEDSSQQHIMMPEKKRARNIGSKNKRLLMPSDDALELRVTWEEAQELLRPPPMNSPTIIKIENYEFEEYDEPPVFGKKTIFTVESSGQQEQWAQCDSCNKWRKLPVHVLVPARWTCSDNIWGSYSSCSAPEEKNPRELDALNKASKGMNQSDVPVKFNTEFKKRRITESKATEECEASGLDALATAAVLGDNVGDLAETSVGATTRHPRHRPGCTCIVCIQPPSGKGRHTPNCKCTVCSTVKRRFKTLMQRKKKRQSDREAKIGQGLNQDAAEKDMSETEGAAEVGLLPTNRSDNDRSQPGNQMEVAENSKGQLDLNSHPGREDDILAEAIAGLNVDSLVDATDIPLDLYLRQQNGVVRTGHGLLSEIPRGEGDETLAEEGCSSSADAGTENDGKKDDDDA